MENRSWLCLVDLFRNHKIEFGFSISNLKNLIQPHAAY
jgi:hypothetical protein